MRSARRAASRASAAAVAIGVLAGCGSAAGPSSAPHAQAHASHAQAHASRAQARTVTVSCSDSNADAGTLNSAIAGSQVGDQILIAGHCLLTKPVTLLGDRSYEGTSSTGTVLQQSAGANLAYLLASDTYVHNQDFTGDPFAIHQLTIDCNGSSNSAATDGLVIHSWQTQAYDLQIENCKGSGILVTSRTANGTPFATNNTQVNGAIFDNYIFASGVSGVYVADSGNAVTDWSLTGNYIAGAGQDAIHLENGAGWYIEDNHIYDYKGAPVNHDAIYVNRLYATSISGNYIEEFGAAGGNTTWYGIRATVQGGAASTISGNRVFHFSPERAGTHYAYIALTHVNYGTGYVTVTGNDIRGTGNAADTGFSYAAGSGVTLNVASSGNLVASVHTARTAGPGVKLSAGI